LGLFIAPSVLFFALTGSIQIYSLHEAHGSYKPLAIVEELASVHKDQVFARHEHHEPTLSADSAAPAPADDDDKPSVSTLLLKAFFLMVALSLSVSTAFGLWMGLTHTRRKRLAWGLLIAGALIHDHTQRFLTHSIQHQRP
jgi:hypothetical protein